MTRPLAEVDSETLWFAIPDVDFDRVRRCPNCGEEAGFWHRGNGQFAPIWMRRCERCGRIYSITWNWRRLMRVRAWQARASELDRRVRDGDARERLAGDLAATFGDA